MTRWKMVPSSLTPEMWAAGARTKGLEASYEAMLAAAPEWEPSEADVDRAWVARTVAMDDGLGWKESMRAAILAAVGGHDE